MQRTQSATELAPVLVEEDGPIAHVWLRRNIATVEVETEPGETQTMWQADEVEGMVYTPVTAEQIEDDFDLWWETFEQDAKTIPELLQEAYALAERAQAQAEFSAIMTDTLIEEV